MDEGQTHTLHLLTQLQGLWRGEGIAEWPTIPTTPYREELEFEVNDVRPVLRYEQRIWKRSETGEFVQLYWEAGYWRLLSASDVELVYAAWNGRAEVMRGMLAPSPEGFVLTLRGTQVANDPRVGSTTREYILQGGALRYSMQMSTPTAPDLAVHARAELASIRRD